MPDTYGQGSTRAWRRTRLTVLTRDKYRCQLNYPGCTRHATEVDHTINLATTHTPRREAVNPDDCQAACHSCHEHKTKQERAAGRQQPTPKQHPGLIA